jgi:hypothetical protein
MDRLDMGKIGNALLALQHAFESEGLAPPSILLGADDDWFRLARLMKQRDLIVDPTLQRLTPSIAGVRLYRPRDLRREPAQASTATLSRSRLND